MSKQSENLLIRRAGPEDYAPVAAVMDRWWGGRAVRELLPRLFFIHFTETSFVAERDGIMVGFLVGFFSQTHADEAYIHFVGVRPDCRRAGVGRALYETFFEAARHGGRGVVRCVTSPVNKSSVAFHLRMGFAVEPQEAEVEGVPVYRNYDAGGGDRVLFVKTLRA